MKTAVVLLNFGEPTSPTPESVLPYLERIFLANASLDDGSDPEAARRRARELAGRRAPGLLEEYRAIGGSPLNEQARRQAVALEAELGRRGREARVHTAMQFTEPFPPEVVRRVREEGAERLVALPVYPLCGQSTTVAALEALEEALAAEGRDVPLSEVGGWHRHPLYLELRAGAIRETARRAGVALDGREGLLVFSAHGTPLRYAEEGTRYVRYVTDHCDSVAHLLGIEEYRLGYQNHANRGVPWTGPEIEAVIAGVEAEAVVVDACSFMHEQSETLSELDLELREEAEARGLAFHRVPVPHDDPRFAVVLADLVERALEAPGGGRAVDDAAPAGRRAPGRAKGDRAPGGRGGDGEAAGAWSPCRCRDGGRAGCLNGGLL